jgi:hypothetical protein
MPPFLHDIACLTLKLTDTRDLVLYIGIATVRAKSLCRWVVEVASGIGEVKPAGGWSNSVKRCVSCC